jgi:hypothetical protein
MLISALLPLAFIALAKFNRFNNKTAYLIYGALRLNTQGLA